MAPPSARLLAPLCFDAENDSIEVMTSTGMQIRDRRRAGSHAGAPEPAFAIWRWHRPLIMLAGGSVLLLLVCLAGLLLDHRVLTGVPIWTKPAKFAISSVVYATTLAWLISQLRRGRRVGSVLGSVITCMLAGELVVIVAQVVRGRTSHFDVATPVDAAIWQSMAVMVGVLWLCNLALVVLLLVQRLPDRSLAWAMRTGMIIAVLGMAVAYLMTLPTTAQQQSWEDGAPVTVAGAHTVGGPDGGPGLPFVGWSTVGGDLRVPHFVGLHGLQAMIIIGAALVLLGRRFPLFADPQVRTRLVVLAASAYTGLLGILTWQALRGQSVIHPDLSTTAATVVLIMSALIGGACVLRLAHGRHGSATSVVSHPSTTASGSRH